MASGTNVLANRLCLRAALLIGTAAGSGVLPPAALAQDGEVLLDTITVTAAPGTTTEDTQSWTTEWMRSATGLVLSQKETPQSTSVVTDQQMKDRDITTVTEVMDMTPGVTAQAYESDRINFYSRGFEIDNYMFDGVPVPRDGVWQFGDNNIDMVLYDHVEIVRGATGLMTGAGQPGASINVIRKRPTETLRREAAFSLAYPKGARTELDIAGPLNEGGTIRGRILGAADSREGWLDGYGKDKYIGFGALEMDLTDSTRANFGLSHQKTDASNVTWGGLPPWDSTGALIDWDRGSSLGADWTYIDTRRTEAFAALEHVFDNGWTGRVTATHITNDFASQLAWISGTPDAVTGLGMAPWAAKYDGGYRQESLSGALNGDFEALGRVHQFVVGAFGSFGRSKYDGYDVDTATLAPVGDIFDWDQSYPEPDFADDATRTWETETTQVGLYGTVQVHATDALTLIGGARLNYWDGWAEETGAERFEYTYRNIVTPYLGATYDINDTFTAYASATSIYKPQLFQDVNGDYLDPTYGYNYELGVKAGFFDGALYASAAVFQTDQKDVANYLYFDAVANRSIYESIDGVTTRGFELELAGALSDRWNVSGGYTYRIARDDDDAEVQTDQPRNTLKLATDYRIPGVLDDRLTVGGAVRWQSRTESMTWEGGLPSVPQEAYAIFDASAKYEIREGVDLSLNVTNLFDKKYYRTTGFYNTVVYGDGIGAELALRARF